MHRHPNNCDLTIADVHIIFSVITFHLSSNIHSMKKNSATVLRVWKSLIDPWCRTDASNLQTHHKARSVVLSSHNNLLFFTRSSLFAATGALPSPLTEPGHMALQSVKTENDNVLTTIWLAAGLLLPSTSIRASRCITLAEIGSNQSLVLPNRRSRFRALLPRCCCLVSLCSFDRCTILSASSLLLPCIVTQTCLEKSRHQTFDIEFSVSYYTVCWELTTAVV